MCMAPSTSPLLPSLTAGNPLWSLNNQSTLGNQAVQGNTPQQTAPATPATDWGKVFENTNTAGGAATGILGSMQARRTADIAPMLGYIPNNMNMMSRAVEGLNNPLTRGLGAAGAGFGLLNAPGQVGKFFDDKATTSDKLGAASGLMGTAKGGLETGGLIGNYLNAKGAASSAFQAVAPGASRSVLDTASKAAANMSLAGTGSSRGIMDMVKAGMGEGDTIAGVMGAANRAGGRQLLRNGTSAALSGAAHAGTSTLGKAAARFAPGMNVAIAGLDTANFISTLNDDKASMGKKITSGITAAGSLVSASNIPIASQIGAGVSAISGLVGGFMD